jgi:hypothetical protein
MSADRTANFWQQAEYATSRADKARSDELRRAWLIIARDWANMARREEEKVLLQKLAYVAESVPMAPHAGNSELSGGLEPAEEAKHPAHE